MPQIHTADHTTETWELIRNGVPLISEDVITAGSATPDLSVSERRPMGKPGTTKTQRPRGWSGSLTIACARADLDDMIGAYVTTAFARVAQELAVLHTITYPHTGERKAYIYPSIELSGAPRETGQDADSQYQIDWTTGEDRQEAVA